MGWALQESSFQKKQRQSVCALHTKGQYWGAAKTKQGHRLKSRKMQRTGHGPGKLLSSKIDIDQICPLFLCDLEPKEAHGQRLQPVCGCHPSDPQIKAMSPGTTTPSLYMYIYIYIIIIYE